MTLRDWPRQRVVRPLSLGALACGLALGACAAPDDFPFAADAGPPAPVDPAPISGQNVPTWLEIERAAREGISVLAPARPLPVAPATVPESRELDPAPPPPGASPFPDPAPVSRQRGAFGLHARDPVPGGSVRVVTGVAQPPHPWFSSVGTQRGLAYGGGRWTYRDAAGPALALGNLMVDAPVWGGTAPVGGLQVSDWAEDGARAMPAGRLAYSLTVGRLNYTDTDAASGAIDYGVTAGSGTLRYGLTPALTLESQIQGSAQALSARGLGTIYSAGGLGTFQAGATQSRYDRINAWRYRFGYHVNLFESISLAVTNEQTEAGFGDLSQYRDGAAGASRMRNTLAAGMPIRGWGTLTGTYASLREAGKPLKQRFGLRHSMLVAPTVRLAVGADRDLASGDYEMRAGLIMPVDAFMRGRWLPW